MKYYAHDPIDIEDLNGKRRRGERIDKPSGTTYRPSDPNDPRERELQEMTNTSTDIISGLNNTRTLRVRVLI